MIDQKKKQDKTKGETPVADRGTPPKKAVASDAFNGDRSEASRGRHSWSTKDKKASDVSEALIFGTPGRI
ncbi:MAG: hypothetical protein KA419_10260 [Acidobacteria bacterium]|nr:hypothetical protein [Acidobacteriota bacterium]